MKTFVFLTITLSSTYPKSPAGFDGLAIKVVHVLLHVIHISVRNISVNPAISTSPAIFAGGIKLKQVWWFWLVLVINTTPQMNKFLKKLIFVNR
ncbi:MAG: hypothetical protein ABJH01_08765 [Algoriphagus sp.]|uniref:hypothetical protein n=1 Tax=Algoriphagus sp. TaxID=1872435 RepID=UPI00329800AE